MSNLEASKNSLRFANNVKKTALGAKFVKTLYLEPERLSAKTTTLVLKELGLNIPQEIIVTNDVAQGIIAGQAVVEGIEAGKNFSELQSAVNTSAVGLKTLTALSESNGWVDSDSASIIRIGTSVTMLVASMGTDVSSWVALALELCSVTATKQNLADINAIMDAQEKFRSRISPQSQILADTFKDFQEKNISIYGVISKMAIETPDLWPQVVSQNSPLVKMFPELMMIPVTGAQVKGVGSSEIWGEWPWPMSGRYVLQRWDADKIIDFQTIGKTFNRETAAEFFFELLLKPWLTVYEVANKEILSRGNMSMSNIAALTYLVKPDGEISDQYDYVNMLQGACLTPYDFGDPILKNIAQQYVDENYRGEDVSFHEQAISSMLSAKNITFNAYQRDKEVMRSKLELLQDSDNISVLTRYPFIYNKLQRYMDFEKTSFEIDPTYGGRLNEKFKESSTRAWRKLHNYFAVLQMLDTFRNDSYLASTRFAQNLLPFMPTIKNFDETVTRINYLSTVRASNRLALANIAKMLGTTNEKLKRVSSPTDVGATKFSY